MGTPFQDLRYGLRQLRRNPGFTAVAVFTLALAIGANTAVFSIVNAVLWKPFPYKDPGRLVMVWERNLKQVWETGGVSGPDFLDWRGQVRTFEGLAAFEWPEGRTLAGSGEPEQIAASGISSNLFATLGIRPTPGRDFLPQEEWTDHNHVVILGRKLW